MDTQLVVLGADRAVMPRVPGGDMGMQVACGGPGARLGGVACCRGCIPSNALLHVASMGKPCTWAIGASASRRPRST